MRRCIEDYALIGDTHTAALVGRDGSIDWLCLPRFDSPACFAALLGNPRHGRWLLAPAGEIRRLRRCYRPGTLVLDTEIETDSGRVRVSDFMPIRQRTPHVMRVVEGLSGQVPMKLELAFRFDYGRIAPWIKWQDETPFAVAGPHALCLRAPIRPSERERTLCARFDVEAGARLPFALSWYPSYEPVPPPPDPLAELTRAEAYWRTWSAGCTYRGRWADAVTTSLIVLKAMTYAPTGGIVAAVTTSLPEWPGADRNWDYRFCWLRDATLTLFALMLAGFRTEAEAWREWLLRAVAGDASNLQTLYGVAGEPRLPEQTLPWLPGFLGSQPVRIGNAAADQLQLDVYGEVLDMLYQAHRIGIPADSRDGQLQRELLDVLESIWRQPDNGIWERRDGRQHFTHSKVMAWVAFDRAVRSAYGLGVEGPVERWQALRDQIHAEVCERAFDRARMTFTQSYGSRELDGSLLLLPLVGFLPARDPRMVGTVRAIERELMVDGFVRRFVPGSPAGDSAPDEGAFLACTCWLADNYELSDRHDEACALFERLLSIRNDVGLLAEQYDPNARRLLGNFPQALSHLALVNTAYNISREHMGSADHRSAGATAAGLRKGSATRQNRA